MSFRHYYQNENKNCGSTCLYIISKYYLKKYSRKFINDLCYINKKGLSLSKLCKAAKQIGFSTSAAKISFNVLKKIKLPCIVLLFGNHYVVIYKITKNKVYISDPAIGLIRYSIKDFTLSWFINIKTKKGISIILYENKNNFFSDKNYN